MEKLYILITGNADYMSIHSSIMRGYEVLGAQQVFDDSTLIGGVLGAGRMRRHITFVRALRNDVSVSITIEAAVADYLKARGHFKEFEEVAEMFNVNLKIGG